jgi:hypothetical protein
VQYTREFNFKSKNLYILFLTLVYKENSSNFSGRFFKQVCQLVTLKIRAAPPKTQIFSHYFYIHITSISIKNYSCIKSIFMKQYYIFLIFNNIIVVINLVVLFFFIIILYIFARMFLILFILLNLFFNRRILIKILYNLQ